MVTGRAQVEKSGGSARLASRRDAAAHEGSRNDRLGADFDHRDISAVEPWFSLARKLGGVQRLLNDKLAGWRPDERLEHIYFEVASDYGEKNGIDGYVLYHPPRGRRGLKEAGDAWFWVFIGVALRAPEWLPELKAPEVRALVAIWEQSDEIEAARDRALAMMTHFAPVRSRNGQGMCILRRLPLEGLTRETLTGFVEEAKTALAPAANGEWQPAGLAIPARATACLTPRWITWTRNRIGQLVVLIDVAWSVPTEALNPLRVRLEDHNPSLVLNPAARPSGGERGRPEA